MGINLHESKATQYISPLYYKIVTKKEEDDMIVTVCKLGLLMLSYLGYWEFFRRKWNMNVYFLPAFTLGVHFTLLFLPGLLNFLGTAAWVLYLFGFLLLANTLRKEKLGFLRTYFNYGYILLFLGLGVTALIVNGQLVSWIDNYTHWAVVVKNMLSADRFPTFAQDAISFTSYPLGSSTLIYYFCKMTRTGEDIQMLAQMFCMLCMLLPVFSYARKHLPLCALILAAMGWGLTHYNTPITELLVDTLLPLTAAAAILFLYQEQTAPSPRTIYLSLPLFFLTMNIKHAGIIFLAAGLLPVFFLHRKNKEGRTALIRVCLVLMAGFFLWNRHCDYVFLKSAHSQHAASLYYFGERLAEKGWADILLISQRLISYAFTRWEFLWLALWMGVLGIFTRFFAPMLKGKYLRLLALSAAGYALYTISLLGTYVFSMSLDDALDIVCIDRYIKPIDICIYYFITAYIFVLMEQLDRRRIAGGLSLILAVLMVGVYQSKIPPEDQNIPQRLAIKSLIDEYGVQPEYSYLIITQDDPNALYPTYVTRFYLDSSRVLQLKLTDERQMDVEKDYDYILILDDGNPILKKWLSEHYPKQAEERVIRCFK